MIEIKPLTKEAIIAFNGSPFKDSARGVTAYRGDLLLGYAGVLQGDFLQAFSQVTPELKRHPKAIVKGVRELHRILKSYQQPIYALADEDEPTAPGFLAHVGFEYVFDIDIGRLYRWRNQ